MMHGTAPDVKPRPRRTPGGSGPHVDGTRVASRDGLPHFWFMAPFEGIDVGIDRRSPVSWDIYERHGPFPYTGTLHAVAYEPGAAAPDAPPQLAETVLAARRLYD